MFVSVMKSMGLYCSPLQSAIPFSLRFDWVWIMDAFGSSPIVPRYRDQGRAERIEPIRGDELISSHHDYHLFFSPEGSELRLKNISACADTAYSTVVPQYGNTVTVSPVDETHESGQNPKLPYEYWHRRTAWSCRIFILQGFLETLIKKSDRLRPAIVIGGPVVWRGLLLVPDADPLTWRSTCRCRCACRMRVSRGEGEDLMMADAVKHAQLLRRG